ncbi:MAG: hypothetical protein ABFD75_11935 [Smithella sp.]
MKDAFAAASTKNHAVRVAIFSLFFFYLSIIMASAAFAQPVILDGGMTPKQFEWPFDRNVFGADEEVTFWLCVQRQGNLTRSGVFNYYFKIQVFRPDGSQVWSTMYSFDEEGNAEQKFIFPAFFYDHSPNKLSPSFGRWKIRMAVWDKKSQRDVSAREYSIAFTDGKK